jgi:hypothetical protein
MHGIIVLKSDFGISLIQITIADLDTSIFLTIKISGKGHLSLIVKSMDKRLVNKVLFEITEAAGQVIGVYVREYEASVARTQFHEVRKSLQTWRRNPPVQHDVPREWRIGIVHRR